MSYVMVGVTAFSAINQYQQGQVANAQAGLKGQALDYAAGVEQQSALETARLIRRAGRKQVGAANAAYAAAGVQVGEGSALETERQIGQDVEHDAFQALLDGNRRARGLHTDATMTRIGGEMQQSAATVNAVTTLASGAYQSMRSNGWRTAGPGFSGTQAPAPVVDYSRR